MVDTEAPADIVALAAERAQARAERDWARADELKARIEAGGWLVADAGPTFSLRPARAADLIEGDRTWYGSLESVPSRLAEPATQTATVVVVAAEGGSAAEAALEALAQHRPAATQVVLVAAMDVAVSGPADELVDELVGTVEPFGAGDALQAAMRRATGRIVVVLDPALRPAGDVVGPLVAALQAPDVAVAGALGLVSDDLHHYQPASGDDLTSVASGCWAFRRDDLAARGPVDPRLQLPASVATWVGLLLRDEGPGVPPRRAVAVELPLLASGQSAAELPSRAARRDGYRVSDRFRHRPWLARQQLPGGLVGDGTEQHHPHEHG